MYLQRIRPLVCGSASLMILVAGSMATTCPAATILGDPVQLSALIDNPEVPFIVGDKKFTDFTYVATGEMPSAAGVNVIPIQDDDGHYGIRFQGGFTDLGSSQGASDALINYKVMVTDPMYLISDAHLQGNPALNNNSEIRAGLASVTETFLPLGANGEYTMVISDDESRPTPKLVDWVYFHPPVRMLNVQKDILVLAVPGYGSPTISFVDQTFSQVIIPEPATLGLFLIGLIAWASRRRTR